MFILRHLAVILLILPLFGNTCFAKTLYQRSLAQFQVKAKEVKRDDFTFMVLGDSRGGDETFVRALKLAKGFNPLFILHGGDYSDHGGEAETAHFLSLVKFTAPDVPLFVVIGNHENPRVFARDIGPSRFTLRSNRLGLTLVAVDNAAYALKHEELKYLEGARASAREHRFVAMHVPPKTERWKWHVFTEGADELGRILARNKVQGVFFSHVHLFDKDVFGGVPAIITGGAGAMLVPMGFPGDPVSHIVVVRVKKGRVTFDEVRIPEK